MSVTSKKLYIIYDDYGVTRIYESLPAAEKFKEFLEKENRKKREHKIKTGACKAPPDEYCDYCEPTIYLDSRLLYSD